MSFETISNKTFKSALGRFKSNQTANDELLQNVFSFAAEQALSEACNLSKLTDIVLFMEEHKPRGYTKAVTYAKEILSGVKWSNLDKDGNQLEQGRFIKTKGGKVELNTRVTWQWHNKPKSESDTQPVWNANNRFSTWLKGLQGENCTIEDKDKLKADLEKALEILNQS